jgi:signal peptidase I
MTKNRREVFSESSDNHVWVEGITDQEDSKVLLTITNHSGEQSALITPHAILASKANLFVEAPAERVQVKGKSLFAQIYRYLRMFGYGLVAVVITFSIFSFTGAVKARIVLTGSMQPAINPGDIIITTPPSNKTPHKGDIVAYTARRFNGGEVGIFSHRIIGGDAKNGFLVKGDKNKAPDVQKPMLNDIEGVVIAIIPFIGNFLTRKALFLIVPTVIGLWLVMDAMKNAE